MIPALLLVLTINITPESLEPFQLISKGETEPEPTKPPPPEPTRLWKWIGRITPIVCGALTPSAMEYRKTRSDWTAPVNNSPANYSMWLASAMGMNAVSDWQRREKHDKVALFTRLGILATCGKVSYDHFSKGWERR